MRFLIFFLAVFATITVSGQNSLYFADPSKPAQHAPVGEQAITAKGGVPIDLELEVKTASTEDRNTFVDLVIDDYRYDTPNYFADHRVPNVRIEVTTADGKPVSFRVSSQGGGVSSQYMKAYVAIEIGGDEKRLDSEMQAAWKEYSANAITREQAAARIVAARQQCAPNPPGRYIVRATYHPNVSGKWTGELSTKPLAVIIPDTK